MARHGGAPGPSWPAPTAVPAQASTGPASAPQSSGSAALQPATIPQQAASAPPAAAPPMDPRALEILGWLDRDPNLRGVDAARRLGVPNRTGQRLWRAALDEQQRRASTGQRRLRSVGEATSAPVSTP